MSNFLALYGNALDVQLNSDDRTVLFTTARRKHEINEAEREFIKRTDCYVKQSTLTLSTATVTGSSGVYEHNLSTALSDFLWVSKQEPELRHTDSNSVVTFYQDDEFRRRDIPYLSRYKSGWRTASPGTPSDWYLREDAGGLMFGLTPAPYFASSSETWECIFPYVAWPSSMATDTAVPFGGSTGKQHLLPWHAALVHFAAGRLELLRGNVQASERQLTMFAGYVAEFRMARRPKGGSQVTFDRLYRREKSGRAGRDPRVDW